MKEAAIWIMAIYALLQAGIMYYFFVYKQRQIDQEYERKLKEIYSKK